MNKWTTISAKEFVALIKAYPNKLTHDICRIVTPEVLTYDDFSDSKVQPDSTIFQEVLYGWYSTPEKKLEDEFRVRTDYYERLQLANR